MKKLARSIAIIISTPADIHLMVWLIFLKVYDSHWAWYALTGLFVIVSIIIKIRAAFKEANRELPGSDDYLTP